MRRLCLYIFTIIFLVCQLLPPEAAFAAKGKTLPLEKPFEKLNKLGEGKVSVYIKDLESGKYYGFGENYVDKNKDAGMVAASVIKMHVAYHLVKEIENGNLSWDKSYKDPISGRKFNIRNEMKKMIVDSDNNSYNTFLKFLKPKQINEAFVNYGLAHTKVYSEIGPAGYGWSRQNNIKRYGVSKPGMINAYETAIVLERIYQEKNQKDMAVLHQFLTQVTNKDRIPAAVGKSIQVAHKTGTSPGKEGVFSDAGIVYGKQGTYIVVVLTQKQQYGIDLVIRKAVKGAFEQLEKMNKYEAPL